MERVPTGFKGARRVLVRGVLSPCPWWKTALLLVALAFMMPPAWAAPAGLSAAEWASIQQQVPPIAQQAFLKASNSGVSPYFGWSVAVSGDTVVVGAPYEESAATGVNGNQDWRISTNYAADAGAVYIFVREGADWTQQAYVKASNTDPRDNFGYSVALSGDTLVVGALGEASAATGVNGDQNDNSATNAGAVYVFVREGTNWTQQAYLKASNAEARDFFGLDVALSGDTLVVGAAWESSAATGINRNESDNSAPEAGAAYVFVRDDTNWSQQAYLKASNTDAGDQFGVSVAVFGDTVVVGANRESSAVSGINGDQSDNSLYASGAAYVFVRDGTNWSQQTYLKSSDPREYDDFGYSVEVSGDTVAIGAVGEPDSSSLPWPGGAYVFVRSGTNWSLEASLLGSNTEFGDEFGFSVTLSGDTLVVGSRHEDSSAHGVNGDQGNNSATKSGAAYVFVRSGNSWSQQAYLKASNTGGADYFGFAVALSDDTLVVGACQESSRATGVNRDQCNNSASRAGAAYVFDLNASVVSFAEISIEQPAGTNLVDGSASVDFDRGLVMSYSSQQTFTIRNSGNADLTGLGITITGANSNDFRVTTAPRSPVPSTCGSTAFTVTFLPLAAGNRTAILHIDSNDLDESPFDITLTGRGLTIAQQAYLKASNASTDNRFGISVAIADETVVLGAPNEWNSGAAYVFRLKGTTWIEQAYLKASNSEDSDNFGWSVAVSGNTLVVGAYGESSNATGVNGDQTNNLAPQSGAAYVFVREGTNWIQQAYLKASNTDAGDYFGYSVAVSSNTIVIGAHGEDSNTTGVNRNQTNNSATDSGAAYVFVRTGTNWSQQAYLKAPSTSAGDYFGRSVAIGGDTVVVGALYEDSNATGVNGNFVNNLGTNSGAAHVFVRSGTNWIQQAYLKASNTGIDDWFGVSLAISSDTIVVGAHGEDSNATGVNGNQSDNSSSASGAAYVFQRTGTTWRQQAYLKASNTGESDQFGISVALSGDTIVVGAFEEDSNATLVDGDGSNNSSYDPGAAYVFARSGTNWTQQAYLKGSNTEDGDSFGWSVAVSGDTAVVGAYAEDSSANNYPDSGAAYVFTGVSLRTRLAIQPDGTGGYFLDFTGASGITYRVQRSPGLAGPWDTIGTLTATELGPIGFHETNAPPGQAFYRVAPW